MEKLKGKHNHTLTNILKVFTFALVLLFPFLVFMPTAFYYGFNEHATNEEQTELVYKYTTNQVSDPSTDLVNGNTYLFRIDLFYSQQNSQNLYLFNNLEDYVYFEITNLQGSFVISINENSNYINTLSFKPYWNTTALTIFETKDVENQTTYELKSSGTLEQNQRNGYIEFICTYENYYSSIFDDYVSVYQLPTKYNELQELRNIEGTITQNMSNSWENMWETPLFAWTENTPFTATTNAFASVFNISQESGFYNLIAYFITITAIYLVIDIVVGIATMLTHMIAKQD